MLLKNKDTPQRYQYITDNATSQHKYVFFLSLLSTDCGLYCSTMRNKHQIQREARAILSEFFDAYPVLRTVNVRVSERMTRAAGSARFRKGQPFEIVLSLPFYATEDNDLRETVTHEAAHCVAGIKAGHGPAWKLVHRSMGGKAERCHTLTLAPGFTARRNTGRVEVPCPCNCGQTMKLGPTQAKKHAANGSTYYYLRGHRPRRRTPMTLNEIFSFDQD